MLYRHRHRHTTQTDTHTYSNSIHKLLETRLTTRRQTYCFKCSKQLAGHIWYGTAHVPTDLHQVTHTTKITITITFLCNKMVTCPVSPCGGRHCRQSHRQTRSCCVDWFSEYYTYAAHCSNYSNGRTYIMMLTELQAKRVLGLSQQLPW